MLLQVFSMVVIAVIIASAISSSAVMFTRMRLTAMVDTYLSAGQADAQGGLANVVATAVSSGAPLPTTPTVTLTSPCGATAPSCPYSIAATVTAEGGTAAPSGSGNSETAYNTQPLANEQLSAYRVTVTLSSAANPNMGSRTAFVTLRSYNAPPYVTVIGVRSQGAGALAGGAEGNAAGCDPNNTSSCISNATPPTAPADTRIKAYTIVGGNPVPTASPNVNKTWNNGNDASSGWSN